MQCVNREQIGFPVRPPHFSRVRTKINLLLFYHIFRILASAKHCQFPVKTLSILSDCPDPAGPGAHLSLVSCQVSLTYSTLIALRRDKTMIRRYYACFIQCSDTSLIHPQCTIFCDGCQRWRFSRFVPKRLFFFLKISCSNLCNFCIEFPCLCMVYFL